MKNVFYNRVQTKFTPFLVLLLVFLASVISEKSTAQTAGFNNTFVVLSLNGGSNVFYDLKAATGNPDFNGNNLGVFAESSNQLRLKGAEHNVWKCNGCDLTATSLYYRIYPTSATGSSFSVLSLPYTSGFNNGCGGQDQVWSSMGSNINLLTGLTSGSYYFEVYSDASVTCLGGTVFASNSGLNYKATFTVTPPLVINSNVTPVQCNGGTGSINISGSGGIAPYTGTGNFTVSAGIYSYTITDAIGWIATTSITVTQPTTLTAGSTATSISCNGGSATVTVTAAGGTGPYTGTGNFTVSAGTYNYTVTDANGCTATTSITVTQPTTLTAGSTATSISCNGGTATVTVTAAGGTGPYTGTGNFTVSAGTHNYTVTDANGCTSNTSINVTQPVLVNAPTGAASQTFCSTLNATLASIQVTGTAIQWYTTNTGGLTLPSTTSLVDGTTYYATQTIAGCESPSYLAVTITIPVASTYYADADADGFGNSSVSQLDCTQPMGYVLNSTDCNDAVSTTYPGAPELCNSSDDNCNGFIDEGCPSTIAGEEPFNSLSAPSAMYSYCSSFYGTLAGAFPSTLAQSTCVTGEDRWYNFTTLSTGVTIFIGSTANDILIELQDSYGNVIDVENSVSGIGTEVLTRTGLTVGAMYRVGVRNYNSNAQAGGQFSGCIRHLRAGGSDSGTSTTWPSTLSTCSLFKASYCGGTGVQYRYTWTGLTGTAAGLVFIKTQTSDYLNVTAVTPSLHAGCNYNVLVTAIYTIPNGAGSNEVFEMPAAAPTMITISPAANVVLRSTDQISNGPRYRGSIVAALPWVCGVTNWRWRFTEVNPLTLQTVGLPIEQNRGAASNYINLTTVTALQYGKTYAVQSAPIFSYTGTNYQWGPAKYMAIIGSAGLIVDPSEGASQDGSQDAMQDRLVEDVSQDASQEMELNVYPNPSNGSDLNLNISGIESDNVQVRVFDSMGRKIQSERFIVNGTLQTELNFKDELSNGMYLIEVTLGTLTKSVRILIEG